MQNPLSFETQKDLLIKCWMTHDAMWFYHCLQECGMEKTNKINQAAVRSMGMIEIKRIEKAFGIGKIGTFKDLKELIEGAVEVVKGDFMDFTCSFPSENLMHWEMHRCFAYDGMKKMGAIDQYQCGIFTRIEGWFEGLEIKYSAAPQVKGCLMHTEGNCFRDFQFNF